jgi:hypothetical protein
MSVVILGTTSKYFVVGKEPNVTVYRGSLGDVKKRLGKLKASDYKMYKSFPGVATYYEKVTGKVLVYPDRNFVIDALQEKNNFSFWAIVRGLKPGIYRGDWNSIKDNIGPHDELYKGKFKGFDDLQSAEKYFAENIEPEEAEVTEDEEKVVSPRSSASLQSFPSPRSSPSSRSSALLQSSTSDFSIPSIQITKPVKNGVYVAGIIKEGKMRYGIIITNVETCYYGDVSGNDEPDMVLACLKAIQVALNVLENETHLEIIVNNSQAAKLAMTKSGPHIQYKEKEKSSLELQHENEISNLQQRRKYKQIRISYGVNGYIKTAELIASL